MEVGGFEGTVGLPVGGQTGVELLFCFYLSFRDEVVTEAVESS
jgi:hypothetical protein